MRFGLAWTCIYGEVVGAVDVFPCEIKSRDCIIAPPGYVLVVADYAQVLAPRVTVCR